MVKIFNLKVGDLLLLFTKRVSKVNIVHILVVLCINSFTLFQIVVTSKP